MTRIEIWAPKWSTNEVLVACHKVGVNNEIVFTKAPSMAGVYKIKGADAEKCKKVSNGKLVCYAIPLDMLRKAE